ncbi:hypothetical protein [Parasporobacterium paucivorans]|uniref:Type IV leader peptidase family protein n=1 Tax=Parasporobacterium paucivorans DSM 15970 TaxID=1122934 RepID=A0A1M6KTE6_9FIRM|nr:hypothetical protein [Parasporobacterium paucivorans]SHJ62248.1 hypothetical protein SAMN02745691_02262 [Parasporobacterium paucivorans DSM 15970]
MIIALMIMTSIYFVIVGLQDLWERKIYSFPCTILSALWMIKIAMETKMSIYMYLIYLALCLAIYYFFTQKRIWGAGDSDLFFLFSIVYLACAKGNISFEFLIIEILLFIAVLVSALMIGWIEAKFKKMKIGKESSIAVAPGFAVVLIAVMWKGVIGC